MDQRQRDDPAGRAAGQRVGDRSRRGRAQRRCGRPGCGRRPSPGRARAGHAMSGVRACEVCGSLEHAHLYDVDGWAIVRCARCGLVFVATPPSDDELVALYDSSYYEDESQPGYTGYAEAEQRKRHHDRTLLDEIEALRRGRRSAGDRLCVWVLPRRGAHARLAGAGRRALRARSRLRHLATAPRRLPRRLHRPAGRARDARRGGAVGRHRAPAQSEGDGRAGTRMAAPGWRDRPFDR